MLYTEEQVFKIIKYSCEYQKANCYQDIAQIFFDTEGYDMSDLDILALDNLANCENNSYKEITIEDINDLLNDNL